MSNNYFKGSDIKEQDSDEQDKAGQQRNDVFIDTTDDYDNSTTAYQNKTQERDKNKIGYLRIVNHSTMIPTNRERTIILKDYLNHERQLEIFYSINLNSGKYERYKLEEKFIREGQYNEDKEITVRTDVSLRNWDVSVELIDAQEETNKESSGKISEPESISPLKEPEKKENLKGYLSPLLILLSTAMLLFNLYNNYNEPPQTFGNPSTVNESIQESDNGSEDTNISDAGLEGSSESYVEGDWSKVYSKLAKNTKINGIECLNATSEDRKLICNDICQGAT